MMSPSRGGAALLLGMAKTAATVDPGATEDLTATFDRTGTFIIGCHQPGHFEAGMKATVTD